jgi:excisionase family DNA binding protein
MISDNSRIIDLTVADLRELFKSINDSAQFNIKKDSQTTKVDLNTLCKIYGFARQTVYGWVNQRYIPFAKVGRHLMFDINEINKWIESMSYKSRIKI